jgi:hypothetical protein
MADTTQRHYVGYHRPQRMGYGADEINRIGLYTNKHVDDNTMKGNVIWLITGEGNSPKTYYLYYWFIATHVEPDANRDDFGYTILGDGASGILIPPAELNNLDWFTNFRIGMGNFGLGLQPITTNDRMDADQIIHEFRRLAAAAGCPQV